MTMSVNQNKEIPESDTMHPNEISESAVTSLPTKSSMKRSFDVAFLISQDDKIKQKQIRVSRNNINPNINYNIAQDAKNYIVDVEQTFDDPHQHTTHETKYKNHSKYLSKSYDSHHQLTHPTVDHRNQSNESSRVHNHARLVNNAHSPQKIFDDPTIFASRPSGLDQNAHGDQKSAFTKVNLSQKIDNRVVSPNLSISPELNYQHSLSPSPPIINTYVQKSFQNLLPSPNSQIFKNALPAYQNAFIEHNFATTSAENHMYQQKTMEQQLLFKNQQNDLFAGKLRPNVINFRPDIPAYAYPSVGAFQSLQTQPEMIKFPPPQDIVKLQVNPAAILTSLLPPSLAALSLPAQNVCAKCNISFRMTSDLVYHMRSHHKSEVSHDTLKKRREDKLKCPVCSESFRERHHLTRHMTAHQDKEGDVIDDQADTDGGAQNGVASGQLTLGGGNGKRSRNFSGSSGSYNNVYCK